jgi:hypothetical protein
LQKRSGAMPVAQYCGASLMLQAICKPSLKQRHAPPLSIRDTKLQHQHGHATGAPGNAPSLRMIANSRVETRSIRSCLAQNGAQKGGCLEMSGTQKSYHRAASSGQTLQHTLPHHITDVERPSKPAAFQHLFHQSLLWHLLTPLPFQYANNLLSCTCGTGHLAHHSHMLASCTTTIP